MKLKSWIAVKWGGQCFWGWTLGHLGSISALCHSLRVDYHFYLYFPSSATNLLQSVPLPYHSPDESIWLEDPNVLWASVTVGRLPLASDCAEIPGFGGLCWDQQARQTNSAPLAFLSL